MVCVYPLPQTESDRCVYTRFYVGLMLYSLLRTSGGTDGVWLVASRFDCTRGYLQSIVQQTCSHSSCLVHFTEVGERRGREREREREREGEREGESSFPLAVCILFLLYSTGVARVMAFQTSPPTNRSEALIFCQL